MRREAIRLRLWAPDGTTHVMVIGDETEIPAALRAWAAEVGCPPGEVDYQVNDGLRVLGETTARRRRVDVCGLPRK